MAPRSVGRVTLLAHAVGDEALVLLHALAFALRHGVERRLPVAAAAGRHAGATLNARLHRRLRLATLHIGGGALLRGAFPVPLRHGGARRGEEDKQRSGHGGTIGSALRRCHWSLVLSLWSALAPAQELEPRAYSNAPVGTSFAIAGYTRLSGPVLPSPAITA